jgi:hypothetical protein
VVGYASPIVRTTEDTSAMASPGNTSPARMRNMRTVQMRRSRVSTPGKRRTVMRRNQRHSPVSKLLPESGWSGATRAPGSFGSGEIVRLAFCPRPSSNPSRSAATSPLPPST